MTRWMICNTGVSSSGCTANRLRSGIGNEFAVGAAGHNIGKGAAAVDPELPAGLNGSELRLSIHGRGNSKRWSKYALKNPMPREADKLAGREGAYVNYLPVFRD